MASTSVENHKREVAQLEAQIKLTSKKIDFWKEYASWAIKRALRAEVMLTKYEGHI